MTERFWVWGRHSVLEALRTGTVSKVLLSSGRVPSPILRDIEREAQQRGVPIQAVDSREVVRIAPGQNTQGVVASVEGKRTVSLSELLEHAATQRNSPFLVVLDHIQDPHNFGAILRSADAAGVHGVVVTERRSAPLTGVVAKTSAGALHFMKVADVPNLAGALDEIREHGIWTIGLDGSAPQVVFGADLTVPIALVVGGESSGLRRLTREHCDLLLRLPMSGQVESLNASVAAGITMYEAVRQRLAAD